MWKLPKWLTPPKQLNIIKDLERESAGLAEFLADFRFAASRPADLTGWLRLVETGKRLGIL